MCRIQDVTPGAARAGPDSGAAASRHAGCGSEAPAAAAAAAASLAARPCLPGMREPAARVTKTVYFVRHGQALHNVVEEEAKARAGEEAREWGLCEGSPGYEAFVKAARTDVLNDEALLDASLSDLGKVQVSQTRETIRCMTSGPRRLPEPTAVLVSPLLRTLQSASILFPGHHNVRVCEMLRERRTGLPCDEQSPSNGDADEFAHVDFEDGMSPQSSVCSDEYVEDTDALRERAAGLSEVLSCLQDDAICVVSHKGFLRELERGPLGRRDAKEFKPAEIRVFDVTLRADGGMDAEQRK